MIMCLKSWGIIKNDDIEEENSKKLTSIKEDLIEEARFIL
jgi:hypothetical protein